MTALGVYDPKDDLDAFYGALAGGTLGGIDPDSVFDLVDRASAYPDATLRSLGVKSVTGIGPEAVRRPMLDAYYGQVTSVPPPVSENGPLGRLFDGIESRVHVSPDDIVAAFDGGDNAAMDRMLTTYYRS